jgi:hypothetical protein
MLGTSFILFVSSPNLIRFGAFALGCFLAIVVVLIHITGLYRIASSYRRKLQKFEKVPGSPMLAWFHFSAAILLLLFLHIGEICFWAVILKGMHLLNDIHDAIYFSANTYTSLAYGDMLLPYNWRELSPLMAISGLFTVACTTSTLFNIMGSHRDMIEKIENTGQAKKDSQ